MTEKKFTQELKEVFEYIQNTLLKLYNSDKIGPEYFILSVLENEKTIAYKVLSKIMLNDVLEKTKSHFYQWLSANTKTFGIIKKYDAVFEKSVTDANLLSMRQKSNFINSGQLLFCILKNSEELNRYFKGLGVTINQINTQVIEETNNMLEEGKRLQDAKLSSITPQKHLKKNDVKEENIITPVEKIAIIDQDLKIGSECERITTNLNKMAYSSQLENIYGNEAIYNEIFTVLSKRNKNNIVIVGKSGVGKTDTVRNLANLIVSGNVPSAFKKKILLEIDFNSLFYGTQMRGAFETKMKAIQAEIKQNNNYIFFIDSIENSVNKNFSQNDVCEFVETIMKDRNVMLICTCSEKDYSKTIGDIPSWERYFEKITLEEPNEEKCVKILRQHAEKLQIFHNVEYDNEVFDNIVKLSKRYITERSLPDSAIDIMDKAGAKKSVIDYEDEKITKCKQDISAIRNRIALMKKNHNEEDSEEYDNLIKKEIELNTTLDFAMKTHNLTKKREVVTLEDIKECISERTNVPITKLSTNDKDKLKNLNERIKKIIIGQDEAVDSVCKAIKRQRIGISNPNKPVVFLMAGSTGVGKSYLAKIIAKEIFGDEKKLVRLDMAEYADKTSLTKLVGSGSGYIGYDNGGLLTEAIKKNKHCVLLLDEIEKANDEVHNAFLSMFDEGRMTDNKGVTVDFRNVIVVMTSNVGAKEVDERGNGIGFVTNTEDIKKDIIEKELKRKFKPEFINRIDKIIYFNKLTEENIKHIIKLEIGKVRERLKTMGYGLQENIENTQLFEKIYNNVIEHKNMGARPIIREIQNNIEDKMTDYIIDNDIESGHIFSLEELS